MSQLSFCQLTDSHIISCAQVVSSAYNVIAGQFGFQPDADLSRLVESLRKSLAAQGRLYGAFAGEVQVGAFLLLPQEGDVYELTMLSVIPSRQGIGYGSQLLRAAEKTVLELGGFALVCTIIDEYALLKQMLLKFGFQESLCGRPVGAPCNICVMQKQLTSASPQVPGYDVLDGDRVLHYAGTSCAGCSQS